MGAIGEGGVRVLNVSVARRVDEREIAEVENRERAELDRRARRYRGDRSPVAIAGRTVIVVDDGLATGSTARAAIAVARARGAERVVLAVPVAPCDVVDTFAAIADAVVAVETPDDMWAIGSWYADFAQTSDADVVRLLERC